MSRQNTGSPGSLKLWAPLIAVSLAMFIVVVDSTMMNVAVPAIVKDLKTNVSAVQSTISLYSMVMVSLMLTGGKLGAMRGVKKMLGMVFVSARYSRRDAEAQRFSSWRLGVSARDFLFAG